MMTKKTGQKEKLLCNQHELLKKLERLEKNQGEIMTTLKKLMKDNRHRHNLTQTIVDLAFKNIYSLSEHNEKLELLEQQIDDLDRDMEKSFHYPYFA